MTLDHQDFEAATEQKDAPPASAPPEIGPDASAAAGEATPAADVSELEADTAPAGDDGALEELTLPSSVSAPEPLADGTVVDPAGTITVEWLRGTRGRVNSYRATRRPPAGEPLTVELLEGPLDHPGLRVTAELLGAVRYAMLPTLHATWTQDDRRYLALDDSDRPTLEQALAAGIEPDEVVSVVLQLAQALRRIQQAGWTLAGLTPAGIVTGQPVRIVDLGSAARLGEVLPAPLHVPGASAPELLHPAPLTGREAVYTLGAILYRGLTGEPVPEVGAALAALPALAPLPGAPQLLAAALAAEEERVDLDTFYQLLLAFRRRLALAPLVLRVASGTTIGLSPGRPVNEDACGHLSWRSAWQGRVAEHSVLCVIDGMGGMEAGEVASSAALRAVLQGAAASAAAQVAGASGADLDPAPAGAAVTAGPDPTALVQAAAEAAFAAGRGRRVGATITCAVVDDGELRLAHVGDTRAYLLRDGTLTQLTRDHSLVAAMVASGVLSADEARGHPESNKVLRSLGGMRALPPEYVDTLATTSDAPSLRLRAGDQLLLCSDGIWGVLDDDALRRILSDSPDGETAVARAIEEVLAGGAPDNAAIVVARCVTMPAA